MQTKNNNEVQRARVLLRDLIVHYHPLFQGNNKLKKMAIDNPTAFNTERLVEECMAIVGGYRFVDGDGFDFSDGSECKTGSILSSAKKNSIYNHKGIIGNLKSIKANKLKKGDIRCVIFNPHYDNLFYSFISNSVLRELPINSSRNYEFTYNSERNELNGRIAECQVDSFEILAKKKVTTKK